MKMLVLVTRARQQPVKTLKQMILDNRGIIIREIADDIDKSFSSCQAIFTDVLGMKCAAAKIVPQLLNFN